MAHNDDRDRVQQALSRAGVRGLEDFGKFVSNTTYFRTSTFDEKAAMTTLLGVLPTLTDPRVVVEVAGHLRRPWARPTAFPPLFEAFNRWATVDLSTGWALGDAMATAATVAVLEDILAVSQRTELGMARQMVVFSLRRYKKDPRVAPVLETLLADPSVVLHAASSLRAVVGAGAALGLLERACSLSQDEALTKPLRAEIRKALRKAK